MEATPETSRRYTQTPKKQEVTLEGKKILYIPNHPWGGGKCIREGRKTSGPGTKKMAKRAQDAPPSKKVHERIWIGADNETLSKG